MPPEGLFPFLTGTLLLVVCLLEVIQMFPCYSSHCTVIVYLSASAINLLFIISRAPIS